MSWVSSIFSYFTGSSPSNDESLQDRAERETERRLSEISNHSEQGDNRRLSSTLEDLQDSLPESFLSQPSTNSTTEVSELNLGKNLDSEPEELISNLNAEEKEEELTETTVECANAAEASPDAINEPLQKEDEQTESDSDSGSSAKTDEQTESDKMDVEVVSVSRKRKADEPLSSDQQESKRTKLETQVEIVPNEMVTE